MNKLKELRTGYGMKQKDIADKLGTTQQTIARWETGKTSIPTGQLKDLAVLFGCSVDALLGAERRGNDHSRPYFAEAAPETPFGTVSISFAFGVRSYPIGEKTRELIVKAINQYAGLNETEGWIEFAALNNRLVLVNPGAVRQIFLISDDEEEMPRFSHPEVYHALDQHDAELGPELQHQVDELREELGQDGVLDLVATTEVIFLDGASERILLDRSGVTGLLMTSTDLSRMSKNAFVMLEDVGGHVQKLVNLSQVAVVEAPLERFLRGLARG